MQPVTTSTSLLRRVREPNNQDAWNDFAEIYTPLLYYWCRQAGLARHDAADVVQEVFVLLIQKLPEFDYDPRQSFRGWLHTILLNKCHELHRRRDRLVQAELPEPAEAADPLEALAEDEYCHYVIDRLADQIRGEFRPATWQAFWQTTTLGREAADVAAELGLSVTAVYVARSKVLRRLREAAAGLLD